MLTKQDLQIFRIASKDDTRPILTGVSISSIDHNGGKAIKLASTDGYRLTEKIVEVDYTPDFEDMIVPAKTIEDLAKILNKNRRVLISDNQFKIINVRYDPEGVLERTITIGTKIDGEFPEYKSLIPTQEATTGVLVNPKYLIEALKQCGNSTVMIEAYSDNPNVIVLKDVESDIDVMSVVMGMKQ